MNTAVKTRLFKLINTIHRNFYHGQNESILRLPSVREFFLIKRNKSTDVAKIQQLMRNPGTKNKEVDKLKKQDEIGTYGYILLGVPIGTFILGTWQVYRRNWKLSLIENLQRRVNAPPVPLPDDLNELEKMEYCPVKVRGRFLHDQEFTIGPKSLIIDGAGASEVGGGLISNSRSNTGYCVVTPFKLEDRDLTILVNRGWVPLSYKKERKEDKTQTNDIVEVTGAVRLHETRPQFLPKNVPEHGKWFYRDLVAMSEKAGTAPVYIELLASESLRGGPRAGQTRVSLRNEHMSYIITWYALSAITAFMWHRQFVRKLPLM